MNFMVWPPWIAGAYGCDCFLSVIRRVSLLRIDMGCKILCENFDELHVAENADVMAVAGG